MAPRHALVQALIALVGNAIEASPADRPVFLSALRSREAGSEGCVLFVVRDRGCGMSAESLRRAGEPFYTTKPPGKGMGLGIFLARTLATRLGGSLLLESPEMETTGAGTTGKGTTATLKLPQVHPNPIVDGIRMTETI
jgi:two-component system sensor histidine kinase RegB